LKNRLESVPMRCIRSPFSSGRILMGTYDRGIDSRVFLSVHSVKFDGSRSKKSFPNPGFGPVIESIVTTFPRAKTFRHISSWDAGFRSINHRIDKLPVPNSCFRAWTTSIQKRFYFYLLFIGQSMVAHHVLRSTFSPLDKRFA